MTNETVDWSKAESIRLLKGAPGTQYQKADETGKTIIRDWVRSLLQAQSVTVTFVKADGSVRDMTCTLNWDLIPIDKQPKAPVDSIVRESRQRKQPDEHSLRVFDIEKQEWRSFRFDRLQKIRTELNFK